jgi:hypothetical protein
MTNLQTVPSKTSPAESGRTELGNFFQTSLNNQPQTHSFSNFDNLLEKENSEKNTEDISSQNKSNRKSKKTFLDQINAYQIYNYDQLNSPYITNIELESINISGYKFEMNSPVDKIGELNSLPINIVASAQIPSSSASSSQPSFPAPAVTVTDPAPTLPASAQIPSSSASSSQPSFPAPAVIVTDPAPTLPASAQIPSSSASSSQPSFPVALEEKNTDIFALITSKENNSPLQTKTQESILSSTDKNHISPATNPSSNQAQDFTTNNQNSLLQSAKSEDKTDAEKTQSLSSLLKPTNPENLTQNLQIPAATKIDNPLEFNNFIKSGEVPANNNQQTSQSHFGSQVGSLFKTLSTEVEKFQQTGQTNVQLDLKVSDHEEIKIRLTLRGGEIRSTFITESPELRDALQKAWPEFSQNSRDKGHRFSDPAFQQAFQDANADAKEQRRAPNQQFADNGTEDALRLNEIAPKRQMTNKSSNLGKPQPALWA